METYLAYAVARVEIDVHYFLTMSRSTRYRGSLLARRIPTYLYGKALTSLLLSIRGRY